MEIRTAGNDDPGATGGCVNPTLIGVNRCAEPLTFPATAAAARADASGDTVIAPGASFSFEANLETTSPRRTDDVVTFVVPAMVGSKAITIVFEGR